MPVTRQQLSVLPSPKPLVRATGIEGWVQEVASSSRGRSHRRLVEVSSNIQTQGPHSYQLKTRQANIVQRRGRKRKDIMDDNAEDTPQSNHEAAVDSRIQKKGRGRPRKDPMQEIPILRPGPQLDAQTTSSRSPSKSPSRKSPSRKGARFFDKPRSTNIIDMKVLETCSPSVKQRSLADAKRSCEIPSEVIKLYTRLDSVPHGGIPRRLQASPALLSFLSQNAHWIQTSYIHSADTPRKTQEPPKEKHYIPVSQDCPYPEELLSALKRRVDRVLRGAEFNHKRNAHEGQWDLLMNTLLDDLVDTGCGERCRILNLEKCSIEPEEIRPVLPNGSPLRASLTERDPSCNATTTTEDGETVGKMIDYGLTVPLSIEEEDTISAGFTTLLHSEQSLNQSLSYISDCPLFLSIELKKTQSNRDPQVQLAIWALAGLRKMQHHGWDTSMPMPAISIHGHQWYYYIFFETNGNLVMLGGYPMGTTFDLNGIWRILYHLDIFIEWGRTDYKKWFLEHVLGSLQDRLAPTA